MSVSNPVKVWATTSKRPLLVWVVDDIPNEAKNLCDHVAQTAKAFPDYFGNNELRLESFEDAGKCVKRLQGGLNLPDVIVSDVVMGAKRNLGGAYKIFLELKNSSWDESGSRPLLIATSNQGFEAKPLRDAIAKSGATWARYIPKPTQKGTPNVADRTLLASYSDWRVVVQTAIRAWLEGRHAASLIKTPLDSLWSGLLSPAWTKFLAAIAKAANRLDEKNAILVVRGACLQEREWIARHLHGASYPAQETAGGFKNVIHYINYAPEDHRSFACDVFGVDESSPMRKSSGLQGKGLIEAPGLQSLYVDHQVEYPVEIWGRLDKLLQDRKFTYVGCDDEREFNGRFILGLADDEKNKFTISPEEIVLPQLNALENDEDIILVTESFLRTQCEKAGIPQRTLSKAIRERLKQARAEISWNNLNKICREMAQWPDLEIPGDFPFSWQVTKRSESKTNNKTPRSTRKTPPFYFDASSNCLVDKNGQTVLIEGADRDILMELLRIDGATRKPGMTTGEVVAIVQNFNQQRIKQRSKKLLDSGKDCEAILSTIANDWKRAFTKVLNDFGIEIDQIITFSKKQKIYRLSSGWAENSLQNATSVQIVPSTGTLRNRLSGNE
jgi:hypothetical protein